MDLSRTLPGSPPRPLSTPAPSAAGRRAPRLLAGLMSGVLAALSFPDAGLWPLAFVAYVPLLWAIRDQPRRRQFGIGWLCGIVHNGGLFYWIYHTLVTMSGQGPLVAAVVTCAFAAASGLHQASFAVVAEWARTRSVAGWAVGVPTAFIGLEWAFPHLFPYHLGNVLYRAPMLIQIADLGGVYAVSFTALLMNSALVEAVARWQRGGGALASGRAVALASLVLGASAAYGAVRCPAVESTATRQELRVLMVQPDIDVDAKRARGSKRIPNYDRIVALTREHVTRDVDLVIWPEGGFPFRLFPANMERSWVPDDDLGLRYSMNFEALVRQTGKPFVTGGLRQPGPKERFRNSAAYYGPDGRLRGLYDKRLLVPIGEYVPLRDIFPTLSKSVPGSSDMDAGEEGVVFEVDGALIQPSICYEAVFPAFTRRASFEHGKVDAIVNLTNDVWFGDTSAPELHLMVQVMRAVELRIPLLRSTNTGITAWISLAGRVEQRAPLFEPAVLDVHVPIRDVWSAYRTWGDVFLAVMALASAALAMAARVQRRRGSNKWCGHEVTGA